MKIILIGNGRMGQAVAAAAQRSGETIVAVYDEHTPFVEAVSLPLADVCIEFTTPGTAAANCRHAILQGLPTVCGTTAWLEELPQVEQLVRELDGSFFYATNFSVGVNILFSMADRLAAINSHLGGYRPAIVERHHIHKLDAPSGTAITLAREVLAHERQLEGWKLSEMLDFEAPFLPIVAERQGETPGLHRLIYRSQYDELILQHEAFGREALAEGVLMAARYAITHKGIHSMKTLLALD